MTELWISLKDIPAEGQDFTFTDQSLWTGPMKEFGIAGSVSRPFAAAMSIVPQDGGFLVTGEFSGSLTVSCVLCAEEFELPLSGRFESYEEPEKGGEELEGESRVRLTKGAPEFDAAGFLWEQFLLVLPENPVCAAECKGLCPQCGVNRNQGMCACVEDKGDPRLAVLRNLKLQ